jgi:hypothetical protein
MIKEKYLLWEMTHLGNVGKVVMVEMLLHHSLKRGMANHKRLIFMERKLRRLFVATDIL